MIARISQPIKILLVEDNPGDIRLVRIALEESKLHLNLSVVEDGIEALKFLHQQAPYTHQARPDLILLDLNLPKKNGYEVLADVKQDEILKKIPLVILTTSEAEEDIVRAYQLLANCYITKPVDLSQFLKIVQSIEEFWFTIVKLPRE